MTEAPFHDAPVDADVLMGRTPLTPEQQHQLAEVVKLGKSFVVQRVELTTEALKAPGDLAEKIARAVLGCLDVLTMAPGNLLPAPFMIPVGRELVSYAGQHVSTLGIHVADNDVPCAIELVVSAVLKANGLHPKDIASAGRRELQGGAVLH